MADVTPDEARALADEWSACDAKPIGLLQSTLDALRSLAAQVERLTREIDFIRQDFMATSVGQLRAQVERLEADKRRLEDGIEELVRDEVISAGRGRELHGLSVEEQRIRWRHHYSIEHRVVLPTAMNEEPANARDEEPSA